jgi:hypothetical protein
MSDSTGLVLAVGGITAANELVFAPIANGGSPWKNFNWRIIPATGIFALAMAGIDQVSPPLGKGIAAIALVTVIFAQFGNTPPLAVNLSKVLGYTK